MDGEQPWKRRRTRRKERGKQSRGIHFCAGNRRKRPEKRLANALSRNGNGQTACQKWTCCGGKGLPTIRGHKTHTGESRRQGGAPGDDHGVVTLEDQLRETRERFRVLDAHIRSRRAETEQKLVGRAVGEAGLGKKNRRNHTAKHHCLGNSGYLRLRACPGGRIPLRTDAGVELRPCNPWRMTQSSPP